MSRKILLADDSLTIQKVVELTFAETDYDVISVSSGDELLERLSELQPDIVICDVIMPGRDGYDVCQEIKSSPDTLHLPVVLLTGTFEPFDRDRALAAGCSEIITKPFEARKLVETVEKLSTSIGAPPPATAVEEEDFELEGQVTPPPPIAAPEIAFEPEAEAEFEGIDVPDDFAVEEEVGESPEIEFAADAEDQPADFDSESPAFEAAAQSIELDFEAAAVAGEDSFELPEVEAPLEIEADANPRADGVETLAFDSGAGMTDDGYGVELETEQQPEEEFEDPFSSKVDDQEPEEEAENPFAPESGLQDPVELDTPDLDDPPSDQAREHTQTTPIDVAAVMKEAEAEEWAPIDDEEAEPSEVDFSDVDTQDLLERADRAVEAADGQSPAESIDAEAPVDSLDEEIPAEDLTVEYPEDEPVDEASSEPVSFEPPFEPVAVETPDDSFEDEAPSEPVAVDAPAEVSAAKPPAVDGPRLSDEDVDRIARRLLELASDRIEHIAWDVIPDMAEIVVRERVRELEAETEQ